MRFKRCIVFLLTFTLIFSVYAYGADYFNLDNVYSITKELSKEKYRGRLAGDKGNQLTAEYIESFFKEKGLKPAGDNDSFYQSFDVTVPVVNGGCSLKVYSLNNSLVKEYIYGRDFKELCSGASRPGIVKGSLSSDLNSSSPIYLEKVSLPGECTYVYNQDMQLYSSGIKAVLVPSNGDFRFRTPYKLQQSPLYQHPEAGIIKLSVSEDILPELKAYCQKGYLVEVKSTLQIETKSVSNVIGIMEGWDKSLPPLVLSAHFDHVGFDADGTIYPGALDNASGTAMLLECINAIKSSGSTQRTVIFAAFNAEEEGLIGSSYFVKHPPMDLTRSECINFDMVGSVKDIPLTILSSHTRTSFSDEIQSIAKSLLIKTSLLHEPNSDHASFNASGINAVTLIHDDVDKIHTPEDTIENVSLEHLSAVAKVVESYIAYDGKVIVRESAQEETAVTANTHPYKGISNMDWVALAIAAMAVLLQLYIVKKRKSQSN